MIGYSYRRQPGGRRYSSADRTAAREAGRNQLPPTLFPIARGAMTSPDGIETLVDVLFEVESNRLRRPVTTTLIVNGSTVSPAVGDVATLANGRANPTHRFGITDASYADDAVTFDPEAGDESSVGFAVTTGKIALNGDAELPNPGAGASRDRWLSGVFLGASFTVTQAALPTTDMALPDDGSFARTWVVESGSSATLPAADRDWLFPTGAIETRYTVPPSGVFMLTVVANVEANAYAAVRPTCIVNYSVGGVAQPIAWASGFAIPVPGRPSGGGPARQPKRVLQTYTLNLPAGAIVTSLTPWIGFDATTLASRVEVAAVQVYAGPERSNVAGITAAVPLPASDRPTIQQVWTDARRVNRVDLSGEYRGGQITSATIQLRTTPAGAWVDVAAAASGARLAIDLGQTYYAYGVRAVIEETTSGEGGRVWASELDPSYVVDVSDDVASLLVSWSRETAPGNVTNPVGNYEASTLTIELDNTDAEWNPAKNAALDVGHRVECAVGVRYHNFSSNPLVDVDLTGWAAGATQSISRVTRTSGLDDDAPADTAARVTVAAGSDPVIYAPPVYAPVGNYRRLGLWVKYDGQSTGEVEASLVAWAEQPDDTLAGAVEITPPIDRPKWSGPGWGYLQIAAVMPPGYTHVGIRVKGQGGGAAAQTITATRHYTGAHNGGDATAPRTTFEEMLPAGVFYTEPYDTDSTGVTVQIEAVDRLARLRDAEVAEPVRVDQPTGQIIQDLALRFLDYDEDQLAIDPTVASYVIPYSYASGPIGTYLADLAKATMSTLYIDPLEVLTVEPRGFSTPAAVAEIRHDNALVSSKRPPGYDVTTSSVTLKASPLAPGSSAELWTMPSGGVRIEPASSLTLVCPYGTTPAVNGFVHGMVADGVVNISSAVFTSDRATIMLTNPHGVEARVVADLKVSGSPLVETPISVTLEHGPSVNRYGPRNLAVDARLVQTQAQLDASAEVLLDAFRALDDEGVRRLPDLSINALGLLHVTPGDRVAVVDPAEGIGQEYVIVSRSLSYEDGALLMNDTRLREAVTGTFAIADLHLSDDGALAGY